MKKTIAFILAMLLLTIPLTANAAGDIYMTAEKHTYKNSNTVLPYRLILPENYEDTKSYPMIFFFHGAGERGNDNELQFLHCVQYIADNAPEDCIIVAPQCSLNNQWVDTPWANGAYSVDNVPESNEMVAVVELLENLKIKYSVDTDRIYVIGLSMGGFATWDALMRHNDIFAAGIPICGGGDVSKGELLKDTPIFTFHAVDDTSVPVAGTRDAVQAIKDAGGDKVFYTEYTSGGHGIWNQAIQTRGILDKLFECRLSDRYPTEESDPDNTVVSDGSPDDISDQNKNDASADGTEESDPDNTAVSDGSPDDISDENKNDASADIAEEEEKGRLLNATVITLAVSVIIAAVISAILCLKKTKKNA